MNSAYFEAKVVSKRIETVPAKGKFVRVGPFWNRKSEHIIIEKERKKYIIKVEVESSRNLFFEIEVHDYEYEAAEPGKSHLSVRLKFEYDYCALYFGPKKEEDLIISVKKNSWDNI